MDIYRFQSTCPARGTTIRRNAKIISKDFNPRAPRGARHSRCRSYGVWRYFNPRAPRGARQTSSNIVTIKLEFQSTCPARGTTINVHRAISTHSNFNPRAPRGARLMVLLVFMILKHFNPRAPRGARPSKNDGIHIQSNYFNPRAPRGARRPLCILHKNHGDFNPRAPRGARRRDQNAPYTVQNISIHVPREGHDSGDIEVNCPAAISIHVPREGHDR